MAWPLDFDVLAANKTDNTPMAGDHPNHHNAMARAIMALQQELGTDPSSADFVTVAARLQAMVDDIEALGGPGAGALLESIFDAAGDLLIGTGDDTAGRLALGTFGQFLMAIPNSANGLAWVDSPVPAPPGDGALLTTDSGAAWSVKAAEYNIAQAGASTSNSAAQNTTAINSAFTAAAAAGRPCLIPPIGAPFLFNAALRMPSNLHVIGRGSGRSILKVDASVGNVECFTNADFTNGNSNITLENFEVDGNNLARGGIPWSPLGNGMIGFRGTTTSCKNIKILNMVVHHALGVGIGFSGADTVLVQGNRIYSNGRDGCSFLGLSCRNARFIANRIYDCGDDCIGLFADNTPPHQNITIVGNILGDHPQYPNPQGAAASYGGHGVAIGGGLDIVIADNIFPNCAIGGVQISDAYLGGQATARVTVADNIMLTPGVAHLNAGVVPYGWGVEVSSKSTGGVTDIKIEGNHIQSPMSHAVLLQRLNASGVINFVQIMNNNIVGGVGSNYESSGAGVYVDQRPANFVDVVGNVIRDTRGKAIAGGGNACQYWRIERNRIYSANRSSSGGAGGAQVDITNFVEPTVKGNRVRDFSTGSSHGLAYQNATFVRNTDNDYWASGQTAATSGSPVSKIEHANIDNSNLLIDAGPQGSSTTVAIEDLQQSGSLDNVAATAGVTVTMPIMIAKLTCNIVSASLMVMNTNPAGGVTASDTNYWTVTLVRYRNDVVATVATRTTKVTGGSGITRRSDWEFLTTPFLNNTFQVGDLLAVNLVATGAPPALVGVTASARYEPT